LISEWRGGTRPLVALHLRFRRGAAIAAGDVLLFLHADTVLPPVAFERVAETMRYGGCVGGASELTPRIHSFRSPSLSAIPRKRRRVTAATTTTIRRTGRQIPVFSLLRGNSLS